MLTEPFDDLAAGLRAGMRRMAQSVCVLSAIARDGARHAMTASSVTSVSAEPASLLVCVNRGASLHPVLLDQAARFCVNLLGADMQALSQLCAGGAQGDGRFALGDWRTHVETGSPFLADAQANFFCTADARLDYGTHLICVARITHVQVAAGEVRPLVYLDGAYLQER